MTNTFAGVLTGNDHFTPDNPGKTAIAQRVALLEITQKKGDYCYDGNRCKPENLGWRFQQWFGYPDAQEILNGKWDAEIKDVYHDAAGAEHYYRYQKDWG